VSGPGEVPPGRADPTYGSGAADLTTGASVLSGGVWQTASKLAPQLYVVVLSVVAARFLGPEGMGRQSYISFVQFVVATSVTGGLPTALLRYVGDSVGRGRPDHLRILLRWSWLVTVGGAVLGGAVLVAAGALGADPPGAWALAGVVTVAGVLSTVPYAVLGGTQQWREASIVGVVTGLVSLVATIVVLRLGYGIVGMFAVEAAVSAAGALWAALLARPVTSRLDVPLPGKEERRDLFREVRSFLLYSTAGAFLTLVVWRRSEFFFLNRYATDSAIAFYSVAFATMTALSKIPEAIGAVLAPAVATLHGAGQHDRIRAGFGRSLRLSTLLCLPVVGGAIAVAPPLIALVYGPDFAPAGTPLVILLATFLILPVYLLGASVLLGLGLVRVPLLIGVLGAVVNVVAAVLLIPPFGAEGAAVANGFAQAAVGIPTYVYASRVLGGVPWRPAELLRGAVAGVICWAVAATAIATIGVGPGGLAAGVVGGGGAYLLAAAALRILSAEDGEWLVEVMEPRLGALAARGIRRATRGG
jgi:O-antigen/teichoic acid export membrane protein